jgi:hypothetical protein
LAIEGIAGGFEQGHVEIGVGECECLAALSIPHGIGGNEKPRDFILARIARGKARGEWLEGSAHVAQVVNTRSTLPSG